MTVEVSPGALREFANLVDEQLRMWEPRRDSLKDSKDEPTWSNYPEFGELNNAATAQTAYDTGLAQMVTAAETLYTMLEGVRDASRNIADRYDSVEELNGSNVDQIKNMLGEEMQTAPGAGQPPVPAASV